MIDGRRGVLLHVHQFAQELNEFAFAPSGLLFCALGNRGAAVDEGQVGVFRLVPPQAPLQPAAPAAAPAQPLGALSPPPAALPLSAPAAAAAGAAAASSSSWSLVEVVRVRAHTTPVVVLRFSPSFRTFATGAGDSLVGLWDAGEVTCVRTVDRADTQVRGVSFSHTGEHLAIAAGDRDESTKALDIVRVADGARVRSLPLREGGVNFLAFAPHAALLAFALDDSGANKQQAAAAPPGQLAPPTEAGALRLLVCT